MTLSKSPDVRQTRSDPGGRAPYLRNAWYVGALARDLSDGPLARVLLDEPIVFYRRGDRTPAALADRCPHRFVALSLGHVRGDELECGYHGLRFTGDGSCVFNPHGKHLIPRGADVRAYPVVERFGFIWIWPGDAASADARLIPDYGFLEDPNLALFHDFLRIAGNYQLIVDNLLDLSHVEFLHPMLAQSGGVAAHRAEFLQEGDTVISNHWKPNVPLAPFHKRFWTSSADRADVRSNIRWTAPGRLLHDVGSTEVGAPISEGFSLTTAHLITPETEFSSFYFWGTSYNRLVDDADVLGQTSAMIKMIFETQDGAMVAAQQRAMGSSSDITAGHPINLEPDESATRARRILARMIREEASSEQNAVSHKGSGQTVAALAR